MSDNVTHLPNSRAPDYLRYITNLMLARGVARRREIAVRLAIGAGRGRLLRQILTESLLPATLGTAIGLTFALPLAKVIRAMATRNSLLLSTCKLTCARFCSQQESRS